ncbi:Integrin alpha-PS3 [Pseudolycoriella hygida]|uniref:Integrin alpha-PS3 n=1 Tax=Pseudolycoriella hygida TaxID=35572 RepID=A0A9Q0S1V4_9DIPT|nr:Integrin alpha-PS3 [Pseudolycoriella hygida]
MVHHGTVSLVGIHFILLQCVCGFNVSPRPNYIFQEPNLKTFLPKTQSSYFGYSINLRTNGVMVGAPRAQSSLEMQRKINETGAIYKCSFQSSTCEPYVFDNLGNINNENNFFTYNSERKDNQWLGASMDGNSMDAERFVVCAPRMIADLTNNYLMHGLCYWTPNTVEATPVNVQKIAPLRVRDKQQKAIDKQRYYYYMYGEQGLSVHITENDEEILIGAPGVFSWKGTVIRYKSKTYDDLGGLSRRDNMQKQSIQKRNVFDFDIDVPNPSHWDQDDDSYFGYALASGYFEGSDSQKILYVASAPQANFQQGEVYIFDIVDHFTTEKTIKKYYTFPSFQMGEYFGYALAADDFNNDGFYDLAICAPFHSKANSFENGAVYIYQNLGESTPGRWSSNFDLQSVLVSDYESGGRFGSSVCRLGDINQDGYRDIAIGAPYEDNGAVYIYLGSANGIITKPSQKLSAPFNGNVAPFTPHMFGHSLSKGSDIDQNNYLDLAVGAPNAEAVYVYRSYPVVKVIANVQPLSKELKTSDTSFNFKVCWSLESKYKLMDPTKMNIVIKVDPQFGRAHFPDQTNQMTFNTTALEVEQCREYDATVKFSVADIFKPIDLEMQHSVLDIAPDSSEFCSNCVAVNPFDSKVARNKIVFSTGCVNAKCVADLKLSSEILGPVPYILGSTKGITLIYTIENFGETAYLAQINVTIFELVSYMKIPSSCKLDNKQLLCDINNGSPLYKGDVGTLKISLDTTKLEGTQLVVKANAFSTGDESNESDNHVNTVIPLAEFSDIEISGKSNKPVLSLLDGLKLENISHIFEIRNNGPTYLRHVDIILSIPISYQDSYTLIRTDVIAFSNISVKSQYNNQEYDIEWSQNNTILFQNAIESSSHSTVVVENMNGMDYDPSKIGAEIDLSGGVVTDDNSLIIAHTRRRRSANKYEGSSRYYNRYTRSILDGHDVNRRSVSNHDDVILTSLPPNRTIIFDCYDSEASLCVQAKFSVNNFQVGNTPILIQLNFSVDLNKIDKIVNDKRDIFVIRPSIEVLRNDDEEGKTMHVVQSHAYTIISKYRTFETPIWVFVVSVLGGLLTLVLITYALYRFGFFRREKKEELKKLVRQSHALAEQTSDADEAN